MGKILVLVAHPDDEIIGVGGTLINHIDKGDKVRVIFLADGKSSRDSYNDKDLIVSKKENERVAKFIGYEYKRIDLKDNQLDRYPLLEIVKIIENEVLEFEPSIIYTHSLQDINIDHQICTLATITAIRPIEKFRCVSDIIFFETLSETEWGPSERFEKFIPNVFQELSKDVLKRKMVALSLYESEMKEMLHPRSLNIIEKNCEIWGSKVGLQYCEPLQIFRSIRRAYEI
ncbi:PIG-L family deacetylase [Enterococcus faecalis]|nr:PIG-L family deacetylase [Enterococcus faecalis]